MKGKHEEESFRFCRKTFSSFICWAEILKSFHFFATLFPSFSWGFCWKRTVLLLVALARRWKSSSGPNGMQPVYKCRARLQFFEKCCQTCFLRVNHSRNEMNSRNVLENVEWEFHNRNISPVQGPAAATIVHQAGTRTTFGLRLQLLASLEKTIPKAHFCHHLSKQHFVRFHSNSEKEVEKSPQFMVSEKISASSALIYEIAKLSEWII